jgi:hypothetical protein
MRAQREHHVDLGADAFDQAADLGQIGRHVEGAVHRAEDVDARFGILLALLLGRHPALGHAEFGEDPGHRAVGGLPLILVDGARQEALDVGAFGRHPAADHLGDGAGDDHRGQGRVERVPGALHRALGAVAAKLLLAQTGDDDRQLMRRQRIGVVQTRSPAGSRSPPGRR